MPSSIYWSALRTLGICEVSGSQADYQRSLDRFYQNRGVARTSDDSDGVRRGLANWDADLPPAPDGLPKTASFDMTRAEAEYLREMIREHHPKSLFAFVLPRLVPEAGAQFAWDLAMLAEAGDELARQVEHARCFSEVRHGAAILYNLLLAEMTPVRDEVTEKCNGMFAEWVALMESRKEAHLQWNLSEFWSLLDREGRTPKRLTREFVEVWHRLAVVGSPASLRESTTAHQLIKRRERDIKGALARFENPRAREMWRGESGLGRLDYRWSNALVVIRDIQEGLGMSRA